jgi:hypothetical protein
VNDFVTVQIGGGFTKPGVDIVGVEICVLVRVDNLSMPQTEECERPPGGTEVHRLPEPVEDKDLSVEHRTHNNEGFCSAITGPQEPEDSGIVLIILRTSTIFRPQKKSQIF